MTDSLFISMLERGPLTPREATVLQQLCRGLTRKEIARALHRSVGCISKQVESIARKLSARSTAEIVSKAVARGIVRITFKAVVVFALTALVSGDRLRCPARPKLSQAASCNVFQRAA